MTKIYKGKVIGNNLRRNWHVALPMGTDPPEIETSAIEFRIDEEPFIGQLSVFEVKGFYRIGSEITVEITLETL